MLGDVRRWVCLGAGRAPGPSSFFPVLLEAGEGVTSGTQGAPSLPGLLLRRELGLVLTQGLQQQRAVEREDERSQVLQAHNCHVAVHPHHLGGR